MAWDPAQYLKFADQRLRPAVDLLNRIDAADPREVCDLGAGAGNVTRLIKARWPSARVTGVDPSKEILAKAAAAGPEITWQQGDLATGATGRRHLLQRGPALGGRPRAALSRALVGAGAGRRPGGADAP